MKSVRFGALAGLLLVSGFQGCSCDGKVSVPITALVFQSPTDGQQITSLDDGNPAAAGIQINVIVGTMEVGDGTPIILANSIDTVGGTPATVSASVANNQVVFSGYTLPIPPPGEQLVLRAGLEASDLDFTQACDPTRCAEVRVTVLENTCRFTTPQDDDELTVDAYDDPSDPFDPFEIDILLDCVGFAEGENVALSVNNGRNAVGQVDSTGRVTFTQVALAEGPNALTATPGTAADGTGGTAPVSITVTVNTGRCTATLAPGDGSSFLETDDVDSATPGMQGTIDLVTNCADTSTAVLFLRGPGDVDFTPITGLSPVASMDPAGTRFRFQAVPLPESVNPFDVEIIGQVTEPGGPDGNSLAAGYWVDSLRPTLTFFSPGLDACLGPTDDGDPATPGLQISAFGNVNGADDNGEAWVRLDSAMGPAASCTVDADCAMPQGCRAGQCVFLGGVSAGVFTVDGVDVPSGQFMLTYTVQDGAGNVSDEVTVDMSSFVMAPTVTLISPTEAAVLTSASDLDPVAPGLQVELQIGLTNVVVGTLGEVSVSGQAVPVQFAPSPPGDLTWTQLVTLDDGPRTITVDVTDPCGNDVTSTPVNVTVSSAPLALTLTAYDALNSGFSERRAVADNALTGLTAIDLDVYTGTAPGDRTLDWEVFDTASTDGMGVRTCTGSSLNSGSQTVLAAEEGALLTNIALNDGVNCFTVTVDDGADSNTATLVLNGRLSTAATISASAPDNFVNDSDAGAPGFNQNITVNFTQVDDIDGRVYLDVGGFYEISQATTAATAVVIFGNVSLPTGTYNVTARYEDSLGNVSPTSVLNAVVATGGAPSIVMTVPGDDASLQPANFTAQIELVGGGAPAATYTCSLFVGGVAATLAGSDMWSAGTTFTLDPNPDPAAGTVDVRVECDDAGNVGISQTVSVTIDDAPPPNAPVFVDEAVDVPGRLVFNPPGFVNAETPDTSSDAGLQHTIVIQVDPSGEDITGWTVELTADPTDIGTVVLTAPLVSGGATANATFNSVPFRSTDGDITFTAIVRDAAGNEAMTAVTLTTDRTPPALSQDTPSPFETIFSSDDDVTPATQIVDLIFAYDVTGASEGADCGVNPELCVSLNIVPTPDNVMLSDLPILVPVSAARGVFQSLAFSDQGYTAFASVSDPAGNDATAVHSFEVQRVVPSLIRSIPAQEGTLTNDTTTTFAYTVTGFRPGTSVNLCSTLPVPGDPSPVPCRWGSDGNLGGPDTGVVVATVSNVGSLESSGATFLNVPLEQGAQVIHAEAREPDLSPDSFSEFGAFVVDTVPPSIDGLTLAQNDPYNDPGGADPTLVLGDGSISEGTAGVGDIVSTVDVVLSDADAGETLFMLSNNPSPNTVVGSVVLASATGGSVDVTLIEGLHVLTARTADANGNVSSASPSATVRVDVSPGDGTVPAPLFSPYRGIPAHGALDDNSTPSNLSDDALLVDIQLNVSDNQDLAGAEITLRSTTAMGSEQSGPQTLVGGSTSSIVTFSGFPLRAGINDLEVEVRDAAQNVFTSATRQYDVDLYGPTLTLVVTDGAGNAQACGTTEGTACPVTLLAPVNNTVQFDTSSSNLGFTLTGCANSDASLEDCSTSAVSTRLQSRVAGSGAPFATVQDGSFAVNGDIDDAPMAPATCGSPLAPTSSCSVFSAEKAPNAAFGPALTRELRLVATDANGNDGVDAAGNIGGSNSIFVQINLDGASFQVERLQPGAPPAVATGDLLEDNDFLAIADGTPNTTPDPDVLEVNLRVDFDAVGSAVPDSVEIDVGGAIQTCTSVDPCWNAGMGFADFFDVPFEASTGPADYTPNTLLVTIDCVANPTCAQQTIDNITADIDAPIWEFDRCSLCALGVPMDSYTCVEPCTGSPVAPDGNITSGGQAIWNRSGDQETASGTTFSIRGTNELVVNITRGDSGQLVTLNSNQGGLSGAEVPMTCDGMGDCTAVFDSLEVPSLTGGGTHQLTVSFTDVSGNPSTPDPVRDGMGGGDETIVALTDTVPPDPVPTVACLGESTTPTSVAVPSADPRTFEEVACAAACSATGACSRLGGEVTLEWAEPADDGVSGDAVSSYEILVAAREIPYGAPGSQDVYTLCADVLAGGEMESTAVVSSVTPASPGTSQRVSVSNLLPQRAYCFGIVGVDDAGNRAEMDRTICGSGSSTCHAERVIPLLTTLPGVTPPPGQADYDPADPDESQIATAFAIDSQLDTAFGAVLDSGDIDGDGRPDIVAVASADARVDVYYSSSPNLTQASTSIFEPTSAGFGFFAFDIDVGDFDADGFDDLAMCNPFVSGPAGGGTGALYLYYGASGGFVERTNAPDDSTLPSLIPDVAIFGSNPNENICWRMEMGDIDGLPGDDIVIGKYTSVGGMDPGPGVYGFYGGAKTRFQTAPAFAPVKLNADLVNAGTGCTSCADFGLTATDYSSPALNFPADIAIADVNGDGRGDVAMSDPDASHGNFPMGSPQTGLGEVYVYSGQALSGLIGPPATLAGAAAPAELLHILRFNNGSGNGAFGWALFTVPAPRAGDAADWLLVQQRPGPAVTKFLIAFKGTAGSGIVPATYPQGGLPLVDYHIFDSFPWGADTSSRSNRVNLFGFQVSTIGDFDGHGGVDIVAGGGGLRLPGEDGGDTAFLFSFDDSADMFEKRAILVGNDGYGGSVVGVGNYAGAAPGTDVQFVISTKNGSLGTADEARLHIYR